jgi:hypothetical protein
MKWKTLKPVFLMVFLSLTIINLVNADVLTVDSPEVYFPLASSFQFQQDTATLLMNVTSGNLNSTSNNIIQQYGLLSSDWKWIWNLVALEDCSIQLIFPNDTTYCYINKNTINSTYILNVTSGDTIEIIWENQYSAPIPFAFIMGIVGLGCLIVGPWMFIKKMREKDYDKAMTSGLLIAFLGFALFVGWVFIGS